MQANKILERLQATRLNEDDNDDVLRHEVEQDDKDMWSSLKTFGGDSSAFDDAVDKKQRPNTRDGMKSATEGPAGHGGELPAGPKLTVNVRDQFAMRKEEMRLQPYAGLEDRLLPADFSVVRCFVPNHTPEIFELSSLPTKLISALLKRFQTYYDEAKALNNLDNILSNARSLATKTCIGSLCVLRANTTKFTYGDNYACERCSAARDRPCMVSQVFREEYTRI